MTVSVFDLFSVGVGPSSSHTVGPMRAAAMFVETLRSSDLLSQTAFVNVDLFGSLAATGAGHGTFPALLLGLEGYEPETVGPDEMERARTRMRRTGNVELGGRVTIALTEDDFRLHPRDFLDAHPNGIELRALAETGNELLAETYFSLGGGFVQVGKTPELRVSLGHPGTNGNGFSTSKELMALCERGGRSVSQVMEAFELQRYSAHEIRDRLLGIVAVMRACQERGFHASGVLPGGLKVKRRAPEWYQALRTEDNEASNPSLAEDWVNLVALAVNEENAAGGRVVTAPTNGAAGIIPAVLHYALQYTPSGQEDPDGTAVRFLLAAGAIGSLFKEGASISGAEVGCQGEVGVAASMAAAGLAEILGGTAEQVENAAEIAMEHSLGLTCDPIGGLVQIPCIERNAISAGKAINAARMALRGDGTHKVTLDQVIATMRQTGADMDSKYKETSTGGLALTVNIVEC